MPERGAQEARPEPRNLRSAWRGQPMNLVVALAIVPTLGIIVPIMGTQLVREHSSIADSLFTPVQQRVLALLFGQPSRSFQSAELIRLADSGTGATHRFLKRLAAAGLVLERTQGNQKHYQADPASPIFEDLVALVRKTVGVAGPLRDALSEVGSQIQTAFVYGSIADGTARADSDIDLMVISDEIDYAMLHTCLEDAERQLGRRVDPTLMTSDEWRRKRGKRDSFVTRIRKKPRMFVIGSDDELR